MSTIQEKSDQLNVPKSVVKNQCIKCDVCGEIADVSIVGEFGGVGFYCNKHKPNFTGGDLVKKISYQVVEEVNDRIMIDTF